MTNNHLPVTPLPWTLEDLTPDWEGDASYRVKGDGALYSFMADDRYYNSAPEKADARYIVHAANAYPELVAALRASEIATRMVSSPDNTSLPDLLRDLLKKLGEPSS